MKGSTRELLEVLELKEDSREGRELGEQLEQTPAAALETICDWIRERESDHEAEIDELISQQD